ncbi:MAG TPA: hypothetical protein VEA17_25240 [Bordetella sp.]|nr:hypothetical protein [Bordetella sp.]
MVIRFSRVSAAVLTTFALAMPLLQGCATSSQNDPRVVAAGMDKPFNDWLDTLVSQIKADPKYKRLPLDTTAQQEEFTVWLHNAYHHRITKQEFASWMDGQYPGHQYEVAFIIARLP